MSRLRIALVGCGTVARRAYAPVLASNPSVDLVGICDPNSEAARDVSRRIGFRGPVYEGLDGVLAAKRVEAVVICTPGPTHYSIAKRALEAGKHVLVEKPPALAMEESKELVRLAEERNLKLGVVLNYRYRDVIVALKHHADEGRLGRVVKIHVVHHGPLVYTESPWTWDEKASKYLLFESAIHFLDVMVHLCGPHERVLQVTPFVQESIQKTTDLYVMTEFQGGTLGLLEIAADSTRHSSYYTHITVYGSGMDAFIQFFPPSIRLIAGLHNPITKLTSDVTVLARMVAKIITGRYLAYRNVSHKRVIDAFVDWVCDERDFPLALGRVLPTMRLIHDIEREIPSYQITRDGGT